MQERNIKGHTDLFFVSDVNGFKYYVTVKDQNYQHDIQASFKYLLSESMNVSYRQTFSLFIKKPEIEALDINSEYEIEIMECYLQNHPDYFDKMSTI